MGVCCRSEEKLKAARAALGQAAVHLIRINSLKGDPAAVVGYERKWRLPLPGCLPSGGAGEPPSRPDVPAAVRLTLLCITQPLHWKDSSRTVKMTAEH